MPSPRSCLVLLTLTACSYFPSHEEVFVPVPLSIGDARVVDGDTSWVLAAETYELVAPRQELLPDARRALDEAADQFRAIFGVAPARVTVALHEPAEKEDDELRATTRLAGGSGGEVVPVPVPRADRDRPRAAMRPRALPLAPVARAWLSAYIDGRAATPRLRTAYAPGTALSDDPRLPDWLEYGIVQTVAGAPVRDLALAQLARQRADAIPLRDLMSMARPEGAAGAVLGDDPLARGEDDRRYFGGELEGARLFAVESYGVARFLGEVEGRAILGAMVDRVIAGETAISALGDAKHLPGDIESLQREWDRWLAAEYEDGPRR